MAEWLDARPEIRDVVMRLGKSAIDGRDAGTREREAQDG
jgi:hypothetical protein